MDRKVHNAAVTEIKQKQLQIKILKQSLVQSATIIDQQEKTIDDLRSELTAIRSS